MSIRSPSSNAYLLLARVLLTGLFIFAATSGFAAQIKNETKNELEKLKTAVSAGQIRHLKALQKAFLTTPKLAKRFYLSESTANTLRAYWQPNDGLNLHSEASQQTTPKHIVTLTEQLLKINYSSLSGHILLHNYYLGLKDAKAAHHKKIATAIFKAFNKASGNGDENNPIIVPTPSAAYAYARLAGFVSLGGVYTSKTEGALGLILLVESIKNGQHKHLYFNLNAVWKALKQQYKNEAAGKTLQLTDFIFRLAQAADDVAQATIGYNISSKKDPKHTDIAIDWLSAANNQGNLTATLLLARFYQKLHKTSTNDADRFFLLEQAQKLYLQAIARGSAEGALELGLLYLADAFLSNQKGLGVALLEQASQHDQVAAKLVLAQVYMSDFPVRTADNQTSNLKSLPAAASLLQEAAELGNKRAKLAYCRLRQKQNNGVNFDQQAWRWLKELIDSSPSKAAANEDKVLAAEAMLLLGWAKARGLAVKKNFKIAKQWWRRASQSTKEPRIINEVAYLFAAIEEPELRDAKIALQLMDKLMNFHPTAQNNYAYLDTWAAAYAANNQFQRAIYIQQSAITAAMASNSPDLNILKGHLEAFQQGELIYDAASQ